jgi:hypothetical protein
MKKLFFIKEDDFLNRINDLKNKLYYYRRMLNNVIINPIYIESDIKIEVYDLLNNIKYIENNRQLKYSNSSVNYFSSINNYLINMNANYTNPYDPILKKNILVDGLTPEDARIIIIDNKINLLYNRCSLNENNNRLMHLLDIETCEEKILGKNISNTFEKNWGLFNYDNNQYIVYSIVPFIVYKINKLDNQNCEKCKTQKYYKILENFKNRYKNYELYIRNSSKAIFYNNEFYALGHIVIHLDNLSDKCYLKLIEYNKEQRFFKTYKKLYLGFIYKFKFINNKFIITKISNFFSINNKNNLIDYFTDLTMYNNHIIIGHGHDDKKTILSRININTIKFYNTNSYNKLLLYNLKKINSIDYTNIIKNKLQKYKIFNKFKINIFNTGVEIFNGQMYITCRFLYGSVRNWFGVNYIILIKLKDIFSYSFETFDIYFYNYITQKIEKK